MSAAVSEEWDRKGGEGAKGCRLTGMLGSFGLFC